MYIRMFYIILELFLILKCLFTNDLKFVFIEGVGNKQQINT